MVYTYLQIPQGVCMKYVQLLMCHIPQYSVFFKENNRYNIQRLSSMPHGTLETEAHCPVGTRVVAGSMCWRVAAGPCGDTTSEGLVLSFSKGFSWVLEPKARTFFSLPLCCLLYTSDAADERK